jgi:hypothetical protein
MLFTGKIRRLRPNPRFFLFNHRNFVEYTNVGVFSYEQIFDEFKDESQHFFGAIADDEATSGAKDHKRYFCVFFAVIQFAHFHPGIFVHDASPLRDWIEPQFTVEIEFAFDSWIRARVIGRINVIRLVF